MLIPQGRKSNIYHIHQLNSIGNEHIKHQKWFVFLGSWIKMKMLLISFFLKIDNTFKKPILENELPIEHDPNMVDVQNQ